MRAYRTTNGSWKQDDNGKPSEDTQNGNAPLGSGVSQATLNIAKEDVTNKLTDVIATMGMVQFAYCFYQMATRFLSDSPGFDCENVYGPSKQIQKLLCEALDKSNGEYVSPKSGSKDGINPYIRCTSAANPDQLCLPATVGDFVTLSGKDGN